MPFSMLKDMSIEDFPDLQSVPKYRRLDSRVIDKLGLAVPFDFISVSGLDIDRYRIGEGISADTTLPPAFIEAYIVEGMVKVDPFVRAARAGTGTVREAEAYKDDELPHRLAYLLRTFGIHNRVLFPIRRADVTYGAVTITRATPFDDDEIAFMEVVAEAIHSSVTQTIRERFIAEQMKLTPGELACLTQASFGLTSDDIAKATGYQPDTVNSYIKQAVKKLGVGNRTHAIAEAIRRKLIV